MKFLGTSAAEGIPAPFCRCPICENARKVGGKEKRLRSSFKVSEKLAIDLGADFVSEAMLHDEDFFELEYLLYTHTHEDHFNYMVPWTRFVSRVKREFPLNIYFTEDAYNVLGDFYLCSPVTKYRENYSGPDNVVFHQLHFYKREQLGEYWVTPYRGNHKTNIEKTSAHYLIELPDGRRMYYALDGGYYFEETFEALRNAKLDLLISECTCPYPGDPHSTHMNLTALEATFDRLYANGTITADTVIWLTHIQPHGMTHAQLTDYWSGFARDYRVKVAWDGLAID